MATSGSKDFSLNRDQVIRGALRLLGGQIGSSSHPSEAFENASEALNMMLKHWQAEGIGIWMLRDIYIFLAKDTVEYSLGSSGHFTYSMVSTELSADAASGAASVTLDSVTGVADGYYIGIELDDGTLQWTTVSGDPSGTTVTLSAVLTGAASEDNKVYAYESKADRPLELIEDTMRRVMDDGTDIPMRLVSKSEYLSIPTKTSSGTPNQAYHDRQLGTSKLFVWQAPSSVKEYIQVSARVEIDDMDAATNDFELPKEWLRALKWNLASELLPEYMPAAVNEQTESLWANKAEMIINRAEEYKSQMESWDRESTSIFFAAG